MQYTHTPNIQRHKALAVPQVNGSCGCSVPLKESEHTGSQLNRNQFQGFMKHAPGVDAFEFHI